MGVKVSVILPIYNTEAYLEASLDCLLGQSLRETEILCVDDGSTDGCGDICRRYAAADGRIRLFRQENQGIASARNLGLKHAVGEYVYFMDSDDLLEPDALSILYTKAQGEQLDVVYFDADAFYESRELERLYPRFRGEYHRRHSYSGVQSGGELLCAFMEHDEYRTPVWIQLLRRNFLVERGLCFPPVRYCEDNCFTLECMLSARRVGYIGERFFKRRVRDNSIMTTRPGYVRFRDHFFVYLYLQSVLYRVSPEPRVFEAASKPVGQLLSGCLSIYPTLSAEDRALADSMPGVLGVLFPYFKGDGGGRRKAGLFYKVGQFFRCWKHHGFKTAMDRTLEFLRRG